MFEKSKRRTVQTKLPKPKIIPLIIQLQLRKHPGGFPNLCSIKPKDQSMFQPILIHLTSSTKKIKTTQIRSLNKNSNKIKRAKIDTLKMFKTTTLQKATSNRIIIRIKLRILKQKKRVKRLKSLLKQQKSNLLISKKINLLLKKISRMKNKRQKLLIIRRRQKRKKLKQRLQVDHLIQRRMERAGTRSILPLCL